MKTGTGAQDGYDDLRKARKNANSGKKAPSVDAVTLDDFVAYMPQHSYIFRPSGEMWPARSVNARIPPVGNGAQSRFRQTPGWTATSPSSR